MQALLSLHLIFEILVTYLFLIPLRKEVFNRKLFLLISVLLMITGEVVYFCIYESFLSLYWILRPAMAFFCIFLLVKETVRMKLTEIIYYSIWIYLVKELAFDVPQIIVAYMYGEKNIYALEQIIIVIVVHIVIFVMMYILVAQKLPIDENFSVNKSNVRVAIFLCSVVTVIKPISGLVVQSGIAYAFFIVLQVFINLLVEIILYTKLMEARRVEFEKEMQMQKRLWNENKKQLEKAQKDYELINIKYHDLKHYINAAKSELDLVGKEGVLDDLEQSIKGFVSHIETGNLILDTVLTQKAMLCEQNNIRFSCVTDGKLLNKVDAVDLYVLFGNAIDNSIEAIKDLTNDKKVISVVIVRVKDMVKVQIENYFDKPIQYNGELPVTTKKDKNNHGFGLVSIKNVAEKYDGYMSVTTENNIFELHILFPVSATYEEKATS